MIQVYSMGIQFRGASISAGEFGAVDENHALVNFPGKQGKDYMYPKPGSSFSYYSGKGMNTFRIPFRWERMQPNLAIHSLNPADIIPLKAAVEYATNTLDAFVILDPQNFARYQGQVIGSEFVTIAHFARFWSLLAKEFKSNPKVMFSLINEPYDIQQSKWIDTANAAVAAIRSSGASNTILLPGTRWTGGHSWTIEDKWGDSNANTILNVKDPLNNMIIEIHQYLDKDYSGESGECVSTRIGSQALSQVTAWLRANNVKGILAETGGSQSPECIKAIDDIIGFVESNSDAWVGWLWWGAGPWWGDYMFSIEPDSDRSDKPQMKVLEKYLQSLPQN